MLPRWLRRSSMYGWKSLLPAMLTLTVSPHWICGTLLVPESQPDGGGGGRRVGGGGVGSGRPRVGGGGVVRGGVGGGVGDGSQITLRAPKHCEVFTRSVVGRADVGVQVSSSVTTPVPA